MRAGARHEERAAIACAQKAAAMLAGGRLFDQRRGRLAAAQLAITGRP